MEIIFENKQLQKLCESESKAKKKLGARCSEILYTRLAQISSAETLRDLLPPMPGKFHPLKGNREEQWACSLEGAKRLVFCSTDQSCTRAEEIREVTIVEIVDYH